MHPEYHFPSHICFTASNLDQ